MAKWLIAFCMGLAFLGSASGQVPVQINYQGRLVDGTNLYQGIAAFAFALFDDKTNGTLMYKGSNVATVVDGLYATSIGEYTTSGSLNDALDHPEVWLEVTINGNTLSPRERLIAAPYSLMTYGLRVSEQHSVTLNPVRGTNEIATSSQFGFMGGGHGNTIGDASHFVALGGGLYNIMESNCFASVIAGGSYNIMETNAGNSVIGGGANNRILSSYSFVGGGYDNRVFTNSVYGSVGGGFQNRVRSRYGTIGGGQANEISGSADNSTIPGGRENFVAPSATNSFAAGFRAAAQHPGVFIWADNNTDYLNSSAPNETTFRSSGGFRIFSNRNLTNGVTLAANSGSWTAICDENAKEDFEPVKTGEVLEKVAALPIRTWRYRGQSEEIRHMGPTAQDFYAAFGLGDLPGNGITAVDADGVAFAAIQALARENADLRSELAALKEAVAALQEQQSTPSR